MKGWSLILFGFLLACQASAMVSANTAVVIVSGGAAVSPFTTPKNACSKGYAAGSTDSFMREYLLGKGYKVFTSPAMAGYGQVPAEAGKEAGPFADCPKALPEYMTVNSTGDIQLAGVHLANFVEYLRRQYGIRQVHFVAHSMGGLYSRSAIQYLKQTKSKVKALSLTTLGTPWQGTPFANPTDPKDPVSGCDGQEICKFMLSVFDTEAPIIRVELNREQMTKLNAFNAGVLDQIPVTLIGGNAFTKPGGNPNIWPNDGIVDLASAMAQDVPDSVIKHRQCHLYEGGTHSLWVSENSHPALPDDTAITWNNTVGAWVDEAIRGAKKAFSQPNRLGCPVAN